MAISLESFATSDKRNNIHGIPRATTILGCMIKDLNKQVGTPESKEHIIAIKNLLLTKNFEIKNFEQQKTIATIQSDAIIALANTDSSPLYVAQLLKKTGLDIPVEEYLRRSELYGLSYIPEFQSYHQTESFDLAKSKLQTSIGILKEQTINSPTTPHRHKQEPEPTPEIPKTRRPDKKIYDDTFNDLKTIQKARQIRSITNLRKAPPPHQNSPYYEITFNNSQGELIPTKMRLIPGESIIIENNEIIIIQEKFQEKIVYYTVFNGDNQTSSPINIDQAPRRIKNILETSRKIASEITNPPTRRSN